MVLLEITFIGLHFMNIEGFRYILKSYSFGSVPHTQTHTAHVDGACYGRHLCLQEFVAKKHTAQPLQRLDLHELSTTKIHFVVTTSAHTRL